MTDQQPLPAHSDNSDTSEVRSETTKEKPSNIDRHAIDPDFEEEKTELKYNDCHEKTAFAYPSWKKWTIISVIFVIQCSMNLNASLYGNAVTGLIKQFTISGQAARVGQCVFLVAYAFGCELWAPWSEEFGRWPIMQLSLGLVNLWQVCEIIISKGLGLTLACRLSLWTFFQEQTGALLPSFRS